MESMGAYYWYLKIPQCGLMEHEWKDVAFYVQKHSLSQLPTGLRQAARGARICETGQLPLGECHRA